MISYQLLDEQPLGDWSNTTSVVSSQRLGLTVLPNHASQMLSVACIYLIIQSLLSPLLFSRLLPNHYPKFSRKSKVLFDVGIVQMVKAPTNCILSLYVLSQTAKETNLDERVWGYSEDATFVQAVATGFFIFEILVSIRYFDVLGWSKLLHGIVSTGIGLLALRPSLNYYGCRFLLLELPVFFETFENSLCKLGLTDGPVFRYNHVVMLSLYTFAKMMWAPYQLRYAIFDCMAAVRHGGSKGQILPIWVAVSMLGSIVIIMSLGIYWFQKVLKRDFERRSRLAKGAKQM